MNPEACKVCASARLKPLLDFGSQPLCNRYLTTPDEGEEQFGFALVQCLDCGLVQIPSPMPPACLKSRYDWITYNEQEGHLDDLVERICRLPGVSSTSRVRAVSYKDDTTVARFEARGFTQTSRLDLATDLGVEDTLAGLETIQEVLVPEKARDIAERDGPVDVLICRHILEHAHHPARFAEALHCLVKNDGAYVVFEVPDCLPAMRRHDYSMPWEEHVVYYTPSTLARSVERLGFTIVEEICYPYSHENSLVIIAQAAPPPGRDAKVVGEDIQTLIQLASAYGVAFVGQAAKVRACLAEHHAQGGKVAMFGAGHLSCFWLNVMKIEEHVAMVVDDHPQKRGKWMPGSRLPIKGSAALLEEGVTLCLLSLSAESEQRVMARNGNFIERGGEFLSIFAGKPNSIAGGADPVCS